MPALLVVLVWVLFAGFFASRFGKFIKECDEAQEAAWRDYIEENE